MFRVRNITHRALHSLIYSSLRNINILLYKSVDIHRVLLELTIWLTVISRYNSPQFSAVQIHSLQAGDIREPSIQYTGVTHLVCDISCSASPRATLICDHYRVCVVRSVRVYLIVDIQCCVCDGFKWWTVKEIEETFGQL